MTMYRVCKTDGWIIDDTGAYLRDCIVDDCGHMHRTGETAERCRQKLLNWSKDGKNCSAYWYNAVILRVDRNGKHAPERVTV